VHAIISAHSHASDVHKVAVIFYHHKCKYSQTRLISHLWDCQNSVILTEVDINRSYDSSPTRSNIKTTSNITAKNEHILTQ